MVTDQLPPGVVTAIEPDPRRAASVRVSTSAGVVYTVPADRVDALELEPGAVLDGARTTSLASAADEEAALRAGLSALGRRSFARADLLRRLRRRGHPEGAAEFALARLAAMGLLDDLRYARAFVETRAERGRGPLRLKRDLLALGVPDSVIEQALRTRWPSGDVEPDVPRALALRRARQLGKLPRLTKRRRLLAYLARRGYTGRSATEAVTRALAADPRDG
jgi:regulatory protein